MLSLVYVSNAVQPLSAAELRELLACSRAHNLRDGLTGLLLYRDGYFLQVLEGPRAAVRQTFGRIERDRRHHHLCLLDERPIVRRVFGEWSMAFPHLPEAEDAGFADFRRRYARGVPQRDPGDEVRDYLAAAQVAV